MRVPIRCELCKHLGHMTWVEDANGWLTRCEHCTFATFRGLFPVAVLKLMRGEK